MANTKRILDEDDYTTLDNRIKFLEDHNETTTPTQLVVADTTGKRYAITVVDGNLMFGEVTT